MSKYGPYRKGRIEQTTPDTQGGVQIGRNKQPGASRGMTRRGWVPASPGMDGEHNFGPLQSGASTGGSLGVRTVASTAPSDAGSLNTNWGHNGGGGVGSVFPHSKPASAARNRKRGISPWGGFFTSVSGRKANLSTNSGSGVRSDAVMKPGGTADLNPGADNSIAGGILGATQASTMVRLNGGRGNRNMRLPVMPDAAQPSKVRMTPGGAGPDGGIAAPLIPQIPGFPGIFNQGGAGTANNG